MTGGILLGLFGCIYLMAICCGYKSLKIAIDVIDASADFLATTKRIILIPVFFFLVTLIILSIWIPSMLALTTMGVESVTNDPDRAQMKQIEFTTDKQLLFKIKVIGLFMFFGLIWICSFIQAKADFICMYSASTYYFDSNSQKEGNASVWLGIRNTYLFHAGSLAFGSLIIAILQLVYILFILPQ